MNYDIIVCQVLVLGITLRCMTSVQMYRPQGKARTDSETTIALAYSILMLLLICVIILALVNFTPNLQDGKQCTQQPQGSHSPRTRHPADAIFADLAVSISAAVHIDWYSLIGIVLPSFVTRFFMLIDVCL